MVQRPARLLRPVAAARLLLVAAGLAGLVGCGGSNPVAGLLDPREDPRFKACFGDAGGPTVAFEVDGDDLWADHFPNDPFLTGDISRDGFIVVFPDGWPGRGGTSDPELGHADLCLWYGTREMAEAYLADPAQPDYQQLYWNVDITGLRP